jgi:hypothetical protein
MIFLKRVAIFPPGRMRGMFEVSGPDYFGRTLNAGAGSVND